MNTTPMILTPWFSGSDTYQVGIFMAWNDWDLRPRMYALAVRGPDECAAEWWHKAEVFLEGARMATIFALSHLIVQRSGVVLNKNYEPDYEHMFLECTFGQDPPISDVVLT